MSDEAQNLLALADLELEKSANIFHQVGAGIRGAFQGGRQVAQTQGAQKALGGALRTLEQHGARPVNVVNGLVQTPAPIPQTAPFLTRMKERAQGAIQGAKQQYGATRAADQAVDNLGKLQQQQKQLQRAGEIATQHGMPVNPLAGQPDYSKMSPQQYLRQQGIAVPAHHRAVPPPPPPQAFQARGTVPQGPLSPAPVPPVQARAQAQPAQQAQQAQPAQQAQQAQQAQPAQQAQQAAPLPPAPNGQGAPSPWLHRYGAPLALGAGIGALGTSALRGGMTATEQDIRMRDYMANAQQNMATPLPPMSVYASYDQFANEKISAYAPVYPTVQNAMANSLAQQLAQRLVGAPIDAASGFLKKKFYDDPKHEASFRTALEGDDILQAEHRENPERLRGSFHTLKTFAPSVANNPLATRTFLRQATMSGMNGAGPDFATIRLMADTEKVIQESKGRGRA